MNTHLQSIYNTLIAIHKADSVADIERRVFLELREPFQLAWVRIFLQPPEMLEAQLSRLAGVALFRHELEISSRRLGSLVFARSTSAAFKKREQVALTQICNSIGLALDRLIKLDQAEILKEQWEATFNAIGEPLCLTDENFQIMHTNKAFLSAANLTPARAIGKNCFDAIQPATKAREFDVTTQPIVTDDEKLLLILFRDVTEQKKMEKRIFASAKMAELGTIGSSIAHDINNPLGGMLSFFQLIKMDLPADHPIRDDIIEMEAAGLRCKAIVENLLKFSRRPEAEPAEPLDLRDVIRQASQIVELQTRSVGIELTIEQPKEQVKTLGQFNLLSQALSEVLQHAYAAVSERLRQKPGDGGKIEIAVRRLEHPEILIVDNGIGARRDLTLAQQIVDQHGGRLEIFSQPNGGTQVKIVFLAVDN